jgi:hypothetical protein
MQYKLIIEDGISPSLLKQKIKDGGKFIVFSYCISLVAFTLKRMSPAIFIENETQFQYYKKRYNLINSIFGWWCIPWGFIYTPNYLKANNKGGIDVTEDVLLNITESSLKEKYIEFIKTSMLFDFPDKSDEKILRKHFSKMISDTYEIKRLAAGWYLNVPNGTAPFYLIGIESIDYYENYIEDIKKRLYTDFYKRVPFQFIDIAKSDDLIKDDFLIACLLKQGLVISKETLKEI